MKKKAKEEEYSPLTQLRYDIIEVAKKLQNKMGTTHREQRYHELFVENLKIAGFGVEYKPKLIVKDDNGKKVFHYMPDLRVRRKGLSILMELKANDDGIGKPHQKQAKSYLSVAPKEPAILIVNFARKDKGKPFLPEFQLIHKKDL
jgi:GxxExxY protein